VGVVDRARIVNGATIVPGDVLIGLPSTGLHTNGYSLARRVFFDVAGLQPDTFVQELGATAGSALLEPHCCYRPYVRTLLDRGCVKGLAHITGGGITENLPRILPEGCAAEIDRRAWTVPPIFRFIQDRGGVGRDEMYRTFNMGIGLIIACSAREAERVLNTVARSGEPNAVRLGFVVSGDRAVRYIGSS
jgi:phosphoribosylformylglycinamidine cyclo-ligase